MKRLIAFIPILMLFIVSAQAASVTVDVFGTNTSNAQANITQKGNNSYNITAWGTGDTIKRMQADINGNASDVITFTLHNFTAGRVIEVKVNSTSYNAYQADSTGTITFTRTQSVRNQTYQFAPALQAGGYNFTWAQFWTFPSLLGVNFTQHFLSNNSQPIPNANIPVSAANKSTANQFQNYVGVLGGGTGGATGDCIPDSVAGMWLCYNATTGKGSISTIDKGVVWKNLELQAAITNITGQIYALGLGAAGSGTTLVLDGDNHIIPLSSSKKTKYDIQPVYTMCDITKIDVTMFRWKGNDNADYGIIAEDVAKVCPEIVNFATQNITIGGINYTKGDAVSINYAAFTSLELLKIKEQQKQIDFLYNKFNLTNSEYEEKLVSTSGLDPTTQAAISAITGAGAAYLVVRRRKTT